MRAIFTRKELALAAACALAFGLLSESASAAAQERELMRSLGVSRFGNDVLVVVDFLP